MCIPTTHTALSKINFTRNKAPQKGQEKLSSAGLTRFEPQVSVDGKPVVPKVRQVLLESGLLIITSDLLDDELQLVQTLTPGVENPGLFEF